MQNSHSTYESITYDQLKSTCQNHHHHHRRRHHHHYHHHSPMASKRNIGHPQKHAIQSDLGLANQILIYKILGPLIVSRSVWAPFPPALRVP